MATSECDPRERAQQQISNKLVTLCLWTVFTSGLLVEAFAPRLQIENHAFVMPPTAMLQGSVIHPVALGQRERRMQWTSLTLTLGGALSLAFYYRRMLTRTVARGRSYDPHNRG